MPAFSMQFYDGKPPSLARALASAHIRAALARKEARLAAQQKASS